MKEQLEAKGWEMYYQCLSPCHKQHFKNSAFPGYEIRRKTKNRTFSIIKDNFIIAGPFWEYELDEKLALWVV